MATAFQTRGNIQVGGISTWEIRDTGTDQTWYTIPFLKEVKVVERSLAVKSHAGAMKPYGFEWEVSGKMTATGDVTNCIQILEDIATQQLDTKVTAINGTIWDSAGATGDGAGIYWRFVSDGDMDADRYVEFRMDRRVRASDSDAFHTAQSNTETGTDAELAKLESLARNDIVPAGITEIGIGVGNYTDYVMKYLRKTKFVAETLTTKDQYGRSIPYAVKLDVEVEALTADDAASQEITVLDTLQQSDFDLKVTFADGVTASIDSSAANAVPGTTIEVHNDNDMDDIQYIKVMWSGTFTLANFFATGVTWA